MRKKILCLIVFSFLLVGCNTDYNVTIYDGNSVKEEMRINITNDNFENNDEIEDIIDNRINMYKEMDIYKEYEFSSDIGKKTSYVDLQREYTTLKDYSNSPFLRELFENITIIENDYFTIFETTGEYYYDNLYGLGDDSFLSNLVVKVKLENKLIDTNADEKDEKSNIYTWYLSSEYKEKSIFIKYSNEKRYDVIIRSFIMEHLVLIIISSIIILGLLIVLIMLGIKYKLENKI